MEKSKIDVKGIKAAAAKLSQILSKVSVESDSALSEEIATLEGIDKPDDS